MKVLVIGSKGFIGNHAFNYFRKLSGIDCWGCDIIEDKLDEHYFILNANSDDFDFIFSKVKFDVCINCSGAASVGDSLQNPFKDFTLNVHLVAKILDSIRKIIPACKFIQLSSAAVYGNPSSLPVSVEQNIYPLSPYGQHKIYSELLCKEYFRFFSIKTICLRIFSAYGPGLRKQLFWDLYQKSKQEEFVKIFGTGDESRDFIYIDDLIQVLHLCILKGNYNGEVVNVANGIEVTIKQAASIFLQKLGRSFFFDGTIKEGDPKNWVANIDEIKRWGYKQKVSLEAGLNKYYQWLEDEQ